MKPVDIAGEKYGRLTPLYRVEPDKYGRSVWMCKCECGNKKKISANALRMGNTRSCGCLEKENRGLFGTRSKRTHRMKGTRLYRIWQGTKNRALNRNDEHWPDYGGRGITICDEWKTSFEAFRDWSIANGYRDDLTIDRINVNGEYCPENCRWVTPADQQRNKRNNRYYEYKGESKLLQGWADEFGVTRSMLWSKIRRGKEPKEVFDFYANRG